MNPRARWKLAVLIAVNVFLIVLAVVLDRHAVWPEFVELGLIGACYGQTCAVAIWAGLSNACWQFRIGGVLAVCGFWYLLTFLDDINGALEILVFVVLLFVVVTLPLGGLRLLGIRLALAAGSTQIGDMRPVQFSIRHLLLAMFAAAVVCALIRHVPLSGEVWKDMALAAMFLATLSLVAVWTALGTGLTAIRLAALICAVPALGWGLAKVAPEGGTVSDAVEILTAVGASMAGSLLVLRLFGFRLARIVRTGPPSQAGHATP